MDSFIYHPATVMVTAVCGWIGFALQFDSRKFVIGVTRNFNHFSLDGISFRLSLT